ncbi:hypothetical protein [Streptomyces sp. SP18BB07]|uniref:hypothetical protein n=1 Tax=Streptomyces sp. SP18BB07 TaxID=3002522 RepID=UPI002E7A1C03|nr:hypothetical protein [Streptomyces sp. SP18BB07]MEE1760943.1 hypothetical protein [Streptomyces sp. SP18BB07]
MPSATTAGSVFARLGSQTAMMSATTRSAAGESAAVPVRIASRTCAVQVSVSARISSAVEVCRTPRS